MADPEVHTLTGVYVCDALGERERAAFEAHMAQCPECAAEVREFREVAAVMAVAVATRPPASLKAGLDARIAVTRQVPPVTDDADLPARRRPMQRIRAGWAVAAGLALLVAGLGWRTIDQQDQISALNSSSARISRVLAAPDADTARVAVAGGGSALLVDSRERNEAVVAFTGLAGVPAGKTYQLWLIDADGHARSVGLMAATPSTPVVIEGLSGEARVGMTIEPAGGSAQPTTIPVMVAALGT